jgi:hypothetical protein
VQRGGDPVDPGLVEDGPQRALVRRCR